RVAIVFSSASSPSWATSTAMPSRLSPRAIAAASAGSSSTTRMRTIRLLVLSRFTSALYPYRYKGLQVDSAPQTTKPVTTTGNLYERMTPMTLMPRRALMRGASAAGATAPAAMILGPTGRFAGVADAAAAFVGHAQATPTAGAPPEIPDTAIGRDFAS